MKHLFLEGPIQTGKSTLIQRVLNRWRETHEDFRVAGFQSQRVTDEDGRTIAFRIGPVPGTSLSIGAKELDYDPETEPDPASRGFFKCFTSRGVDVYQQVFDSLGVKYLREAAASEPHVILLDEIGGSELLCDGFRDELYRVLGGTVPCVGVIKAGMSAVRMNMSGKYRPGGRDNKTFMEYSADLRRDFEDKLLIADFESRDDSEKVEELLESFLQNAANIEMIRRKTN